MNLNLENNNDEWGWFIDLETNNTINEHSTIFTNTKKYFKKLEVIYEVDEEYDYYKKNYKEEYEETQNKKIYVYNKFLDFSSKYLLTAIMVYIIFLIF